MKEKRSSFSGSIGFVLAAAGSAIGLGNIWRFPYLAAQNGGGLFLVIYLILVLTFGFTLLITEVSIGRKTRQSPLKAYGKLDPRFKWLGFFAVLVPFLIMPYYCAIGGWVMKYCVVYLTGAGKAASADGFFSNYIGGTIEPLFFMGLFVLFDTLVIYKGIDKGIEKISKILMPILILCVIGIAAFALTLRSEDGGAVRTGLQGLAVYIIPDFHNLTIGQFVKVLMEAMGQLFYSISVAMGIMISYGSYLRDEDNLFKGVGQIEIFDTFVAFMAGIIIILPVYVFMGREGMDASGPSLLFVSMPHIFESMGVIGGFLGAAFFIMVLFAALTSSISIMEAVVSSLMEHFSISREKATLIEGGIALLLGALVCLGYNALYFEVPLPNGSTGQILDIMDYFSNNILMPVVEIGTCVLIGWILKPETVIREATKNGEVFTRKTLYVVMIRFIAPVLLTMLLLRALGVFK
ncbi:MAG: sodium-dependent transporter [Lachnospiraceae bacterium]|nr:sodium-dependent transporter [Lachnospiraceae bacterium]